MEWMCARCGDSAVADNWARLTAIGWRLTLLGDCLCTACPRPGDPLAARLRAPALNARAIGGWTMLCPDEGAALGAEERGAPVLRSRPRLVLVR